MYLKLPQILLDTKLAQSRLFLFSLLQVYRLLVMTKDCQLFPDQDKFTQICPCTIPMENVLI